MDAVSYVSFFILHLALAKVVRGQAENEPSPDYEQLRDEFLQENIHVLSDQPVTAGAHDPDPWYTGENPFEEVQSTTPENDLLPVERNDFSDGESTIETDHATTEASQSFQPMESRTTTIEKIDTAVTETSILGKDTWDTVTLNETTAFADHLLTAETVEATSDLSDPNSSVDILHSEATEVVFIVPGKPSLEPMAAENVTKPYWEATVHQDVERNHEESEFVAEKGNTKQIYEDIKLEDDYRENHGSTVSDTTPSETLTTEMVPDVPSATVLAESSRSSVTPNIVLNISLDQESEVLVRILPRLILPDESLEAHLNATTVRSFVVINASDAEQSMNEDNHDVHSVENITGRTTELWFTTESVAPPNASSPATTDTFADTSTVDVDSNTTVNVSASNVDMDFLDDENQLGDEEDSSITEVFTSSAVQVLDEVTNLTTTAVSFTVSFDATTTQPLGLLTTGNTTLTIPAVVIFEQVVHAYSMIIFGFAIVLIVILCCLYASWCRARRPKKKSYTVNDTKDGTNKKSQEPLLDQI